MGFARARIVAGRSSFVGVRFVSAAVDGVRSGFDRRSAQWKNPPFPRRFFDSYSADFFRVSHAFFAAADRFAFFASSFARRVSQAFFAAVTFFSFFIFILRFDFVSGEPFAVHIKLIGRSAENFRPIRKFFSVRF
jgi:hypothetical protein